MADKVVRAKANYKIVSLFRYLARLLKYFLVLLPIPLKYGFVYLYNLARKNNL